MLHADYMSQTVTNCSLSATAQLLISPALPTKALLTPAVPGI